MDQARWNQIEALLQAALDLDPDQRPAFLARACGEDAELLFALEALLREESEAMLLETPAIASIAHQVESSPLTGEQIGPYRVQARIGSGGMGDVYEAFDERLQRIVALKALPAEFAADAERVRRFEQEAFAASRLNHPNIITIFEIVHAEEGHFIATEHIDGATLRVLMTDPQTGKPQALPIERALDTAIQIATALKAAHTAWIIHRDIKPENIMVRADGLVKVLDFGIAKLRDEPSESTASPPVEGPRSHMTVPGAVLGTASYMAPEQARGEPLDGRADQYSLGLVLHEMVAGRRLLTGAGPVDALQAGHIAPELPSSKSKLDRAPGDLQRIIRRMLKTNREERYASTGELLDDLARMKRRLESRQARRMAGLGALGLIAAVALAATAAVLSVNEVWDERVLRDGHTAAARQAIFSPDGRLLVSCGEDGQVIVWDFVQRKRLATLTGQVAHKLAFSPDGRWLATGGTDGTIIIRDATRWNEIRILREHRGEIGALAFSPDAALLASSARGPDGRAVLWTTGSWEKLREWPRGMAHGTFLFSPDLRQLLFSHGLMVYDLSQGRELSNEPLGGASWIAMSPDADRLATVDPLGNLALYRFPQPGSLMAPELIVRRRAHHDHGRAVAFSPDGRLLVSGAEDIQLWDAATLATIARFDHDSIVWSVLFSPDGRWLVSTHGDGAVLIWDVAERRLAASLNEHAGAVRAVAFDPDGQRVASAGDDRTVTLWDLGLGRKQAVLAEHQTRVMAIAFSGDGRRLGSADQDGLFLLRETGTRSPRLISRFPGPWPGYTLAISHDGRFLAVNGALYRADGRVAVEFEDDEVLRTIGQAYGAAFSRDGRRLALVTDHGLVLLWDTENLRLLAKRTAADQPQIAVSFSPDGERLVTGDDAGIVRLWSTAPLREIAIVGRHAARVKSVAFSPDGATVASAGDDRMIALWDVERRKLRARIGTHASPVYAIAFSPDGRRLVSGEHDHSVRLYTRHRTLWGFRLE